MQISTALSRSLTAKSARHLPICIALLIALFAGLGHPASAANGLQNITHVFFNGGSFEKMGDDHWVERRANGSIAFHFKVQNMEGQSILLHDAPRRVHIALMTKDRNILYSHNGEQFRILYHIDRIERTGGLKPLKCGKNYQLQNGECVLMQNCGNNARRNVEGDCHCIDGFYLSNGVCTRKTGSKNCGKNHEYKNGKCVWKTDKNGFEIAPWEKPQCKELNRLCERGVSKACMQYEGECQVN